MRRKPVKLARGRKERFSSILLALAGLWLAILALFCASLSSGFVYDSSEEIGQWGFIHDPGNLPLALGFRLMSLDVLDFNRPVGVLSLMLDSAAGGMDPLGYHLTNILLHGLVASLAFLVLRDVLGRAGNARDHPWRDGMIFLATLLFAVHPLVTEAVCEPCNRKDILAAFFGLAALLLATRHRPEARTGNLLRLFLIPLLCLLAIGSKEVGVAYPFILVLYWFLFRRGEGRRFWAWVLPSSVAVVVVFLIARVALEHHPSVIFTVRPAYLNHDFWGTFVVQPRLLVLYLFNVVWPLYLCADYGPWSVRYLPLGPSLFILAVAAGLLGWWSVKDRRVLFAAGFLAATILPVCNLVPIYHPVADRYLYNPLIAGALLLAIALDSAWISAVFARRLAVIIGLLIVAALLVPVTLERERVWSDDILLWQDTLARNPDSVGARANLPGAYLEEGRLEEAKVESERALNTPGFVSAFAWADYAIVLNRLGDRPGALAAARRAIALQPDIVDADKMVETLQAPRDLSDEFARLAASAPASGK
jgi:hypothetical protein